MFRTVIISGMIIREEGIFPMNKKILKKFNNKKKLKFEYSPEYEV